MNKLIISFTLLFLLCFILHPQAQAFEQGRSNNIFGIHLATPSKEELEDAAKLVNSNGGSWGYVTVVIQENDRDVKKWQEAFDHMRELRLIPIVRLATKPNGAVWEKGSTDDLQSWLQFLNSLRWVVRDRYIVLFNEPNHSQEWGGVVDPEGYGKVALEYSRALHTANHDYFVMLAGMDIAAASNGQDMDAYEYLHRLFEAASPIKDEIDGLSSHSYPNPGFSGSPYATGRLSIRGYQWELELLQSLGVSKELPVFITETGWVHQGDDQKLSERYEAAYSLWESDPRIRAVTPFVLSYQGEPFLRFSWQRFQSREFYPHYSTVQSMQKTEGDPEQIQSGAIGVDLPRSILEDSTYHLKVVLKNNGQALWRRDDGYRLRILDADGYEYFFDDLTAGVAPGSTQDVSFYLKTHGAESRELQFQLIKKNEPIITSLPWHFRVLPLPKLTIKTPLLPRLREVAGRTFEVQVFSPDEELVFRSKNLHLKNGELQVDDIHNVYLGGRYRIVVLTKYFLPRQFYATFKQNGNSGEVKPMLPIDFNADGTFSWRDIWELVRNPRLLRLLLP